MYYRSIQKIFRSSQLALRSAWWLALAANEICECVRAMEPCAQPRDCMASSCSAHARHTLWQPSFSVGSNLRSIDMKDKYLSDPRIHLVPTERQYYCMHSQD